MFKNWSAICEVKDDLLRLLVATTKDAETLEGLQQGFPHLFSETETILRVPASALREAAKAVSRKQEAGSKFEELDGEIAWSYGMDGFGIPCAARWAHPEEVPPELLQQLVGQTFDGGMKVKYRGVECVVMYIDDMAGQLGKPITEVPESECMTLAPAEFIDLNA